MRTYVPLLLRPWVMDCAHKDAVHLGEKVTLGLLQRFYWWIVMAESVRWWVRRCYTCQARKSTMQTVRWPLVSLPLPSRPGQMFSFDLLGPFPITAKGNEYVFLVVDLLSRHAEAYAITKREKTRKVVPPNWSMIIYRGGNARTLFCRIVAQNLCRTCAEGS